MKGLIVDEDVRAAIELLRLTLCRWGARGPWVMRFSLPNKVARSGSVGLFAFAPFQGLFHHGHARAVVGEFPEIRAVCYNVLL